MNTLALKKIPRRSQQKLHGPVISSPFLIIIQSKFIILLLLFLFFRWCDKIINNCVHITAD